MEIVMKKQKYIIIISGVVIIIFAFLSMMWLSSLKEDPRKTPPKDLIRYVKAQPIKYETRSAKIVAPGRVYSNSEVILSAEVTGKILPGSIQFKKGQSFKKGDLLIKIYDKEAGLSLKADKSSFLNTLAGLLPDLRIDFEENYNNWYNFFENTNIDKDLPNLPEIKSTKEKVFLSSRNILSSYYNIKRAESNFDKHNLYAPFNGAITEVNVEVGGIAGLGTRLGKIINTRDLELEVPLEVTDAKWIAIGDEVKIADENGVIYAKGKVARISGDLDVQTQSISVFISLKNSSEKPIFKGQYLSVIFDGITVKNSMEIPRNAVFNANNVFLVKKGLLKKETIDVVRLNEKTLFFNGLNENDTIITEPLINANENSRVSVIKDKD
jgi:multidrug efflux pump subunit AcrA (membrane-fusion protein)